MKFFHLASQANLKKLTPYTLGFDAANAIKLRKYHSLFSVVFDRWEFIDEKNYTSILFTIIGQNSHVYNK